MLAYLPVLGKGIRCHTLAVATAGIAFTLCVGPATVEAACIKDDREVKFADGSTKVRSYYCKTTGEETRVRVEYHRLSEVAAGSILMQTPYADVTRMLGNTRLIANAVSKRAHDLFAKYATKTMMAGCFRTEVDVPAGGAAYDSAHGRPSKDCAQRAVWFLSSADVSFGNIIDFPLPQAIQHIRSNQTWPPGFSFFYGKCPGAAFVGCTKIWRHLTSSDMANYSSNKTAYEKLLNIKGGGTAIKEQNDHRRKHLNLVQELAGDILPEDYLVVVGVPDECGGVNFQLHMRQMILDVATIENASKNTVRIDNLLGGFATNMKLRAAKQAADKLVEPVSGTSSELAPGEKILIPLRMHFTVAESQRQEFSSLEQAQATYQRIQAAKAGAVFSAERSIGSTQSTIRKSRESFGPPSMPASTNYIYGPELTLTGVAIGNEQLIFADTSQNFIRVTGSEGIGSCPYLYAYAASQAEWISYGKIIERANSLERTRTQEIVVAADTRAIRIAEHELELSLIDRVLLKLVMKNGSVINLPPNSKLLAKIDRRYERLAAGQAIEVEFARPNWLRADDVQSWSVLVTGYYQRYGSMQMSQRD